MLVDAYFQPSDVCARFPSVTGPVGLPLVGNLAALATGMGLPDFALRMSAKYGEVCKIWFGARPWVVISNPDLVR